MHETHRHARPAAQHEHINMLCRALRPGVLGSRNHIAVGRVRGNNGRCARIHARIGATAHTSPARETSCGAALHALPLPRSRPQSTLLAGSYREGSATGGALRPQARTHTCTHRRRRAHIPSTRGQLRRCTPCPPTAPFAPAEHTTRADGGVPREPPDRARCEPAAPPPVPHLPLGAQVEYRAPVQSRRLVSSWSVLRASSLRLRQ